MTYKPTRYQRQRIKGWRTPTCGCGCNQPARYVGRGSKWGNPYRFGKTQVQMPGAEDPSQPWELEGRADKPNGENVPFCGINGTTYHKVQPATREQIVTIYREMLTNQHIHTKGEYPWSINLEEYLTPLRGHDLMCWCPQDQPCHADILLKIANERQNP